MSNKLWDVIIVGGGPAGVTAALRLARANLDVLVVEAAVYPGAENWSGAVYFAENLADPDVLGVDELKRAPYERQVVKRGFFTCNGHSLAGLEYRNTETFRHCYTVLRPIYDRYLAERARQLGATILSETTVDGLIRYQGRVVGVHTDRGPLYADVVFLAEGDASHLVSKEGFESEAVRGKRGGQPAFLQGVKEVIELDTREMERRFGIGPDEAGCYEVLLRNGAIDGRPVRLNMAGFIYTNRSSVSIGLVLPLDNLKSFGGSYNVLMEWFKGLPPVARLIAGGESVSYGAKIIRGGGLPELPRLVDDGVAIGGAATGIGVDFPYPNFTGPATAMGRIFADAVIRLQSEGRPATRDRLQELYVEPLKATRYYRDVEHLRDWPGFIEHTREFFGRQVDLLNGSLYVLTRPELGPARRWWELTRLVGETMRGRWLRTLKDLAAGSTALRLGRYALKHVPFAVVTAVLNTLRALLPFGRGRPVGQLRFVYEVDGESVGRLPLYARWLGARITPALARAAHIVYSNDQRPVGPKLDRAIGSVLRGLSLWDIVLGLVVAIALPVTRAVQRLGDVVRYAVRKPTLEELKASFYGRWVMAWRSHTDMSAGRIEIARSHDAKLGDISYTAHPASHIKVFFAPSAPGAVEDPTGSSLWSVCPAAVYQINVDRTLHASVAVNFENCVKCETCWRIEPEQVDWTRFGKHRLVYEVYSGADRALRRVMAEREPRPGPAVSSRYWPIQLSLHDARMQFEGARAPEGLATALAEAHGAVARAHARGRELTRDVWRGPRVLEPNQILWYQGAIEYFATLADEAVEAALEPRLAGAARECALYDELSRLRGDLKDRTARLRAYGRERRLYFAEADARQIRTHHLEGLEECLLRIADAFELPAPEVDPVAAIRDHEVETAGRGAARAALRERLADVFDRAAIRRLEHGGTLEDAELELLRAAIRTALDAEPGDSDLEGREHLRAADVLGELARVDPSLAGLVAGHLAAVDALRRADAPSAVVAPFVVARRIVAAAFERECEPDESGWRGRVPFVLAAAAEAFVVRGGGRIGLIEAAADGVCPTPTAAIGLAGAGVSELALEHATAVWEGTWPDDAEPALFSGRGRDLAAIALGAGTLMTERAVDHARSRVQFPDHFQDIDGRDAIGKFGAVRALIASIETNRLAIETLLTDARWADPDGIEPMLAKAAVTDAFGPHTASITYQTGQVIGGTAFSEDDVISKIYRDSSVFPHYVRENAELYRAVGSRLVDAAAEDRAPLALLAPESLAALDSAEARPILDAEVRRLRSAEEALHRLAREAGGQRGDADAAEVVTDILGELATRLYVWARLLRRAHRRLEGALPAERHVEAARLWAGQVEDRLLGAGQELERAAQRVELGRLAFEMGAYPDTPIATTEIDFSYRRDIIEAARSYRSGDFLVDPPDLDGTRYVPELVWVDDEIRAQHERYLELFRQRFIEPGYDPPFERYIERLHYIPRGHIDWTREQGFFQTVIPEEYGGQGRTKADYYNLCMVSKRRADVSHTLTIQANTSIGTTPILLGLEQDLPAAERDLRQVLAEPEAVDALADRIERLLGMLESPDLGALQEAFQTLNREASSTVGRSRVLKKAVFGRFMDRLEEAGLAGLKRDLEGFRAGLEQARAALDGWRDRAETELDEIPRRRLAHEFFLHLISARMISAFALTEPSAGSDTARIRTEARLTSRRVHTDPDGVKFFYLDEEREAERRNLCDMRRFEFDGGRILYRHDDDADAAEVISHEYSYEDDSGKHRYYMHGDRRVDIHDVGLIRERGGAEHYDFYVMNGAKMWITNGHIAGVMSLYARTPLGPTGFMVDTHAEGFLIGKDEEKMGQRGSPTNEITLTNVRVPRECIIGIEGRGQENALETLNVGRAGLGISAAAGMQQGIIDARDFARERSLQSSAWARYRLGLALEEMYATESLAYNLIGYFDDKTTDALRIESAIGKFFGTESAHRVIHYLETIYGVEGQTQRYRIEKDRRDARVMTIYEGTNEIQQFLLLKDLIDLVGPRLDEAAPARLEPASSAYQEATEALETMIRELRDRVSRTRETFGRVAWQRALLQPVFFPLARMAVWVKMVDSAIHRADWIARNLTADGDAVRRAWSETAARGFAARAHREFSRLRAGFDRDFDALARGGRPASLALAETVLDAADAAEAAHVRPEAASEPGPPPSRDLDIVVAMEQVPRLAPRPRLEDGRLAEHVHTVTAGDRRALRIALALKSAAPDRVRITVICAAPRHAEEQLRKALAAGADRAVLIDTRGGSYTEHAVAAALAEAIDRRDLVCDLLLAGASPEGPGGGRLAARLAAIRSVDWMPAVTRLWVDGDDALVTSDRFHDATVRTSLPIVAAVAAAETEPDWDFGTVGFVEALEKPFEVVPFPAGAERSDEEFATAAAVATAEGEETGEIEPDRAADLLIELGDLGDGATAPEAEPFDGRIEKTSPAKLSWDGVVFVAELEEGALARTARAPLEAARGIADRAGLPLSGLVLAPKLRQADRRRIAGTLRAAAPFRRIVFAESEALGSGSFRAYVEALQRLIGPQAESRPAYLISSPWLADAMPALAEALRGAGVPAEELPAVNQIEFRPDAEIAFVRTAVGRKLRGRRVRSARANGIRLVWCEPEVSADGGAGSQPETEVVHVPLKLEYDPQADELARALAAAKQELGVVTLENAEFIIDVGAGVGSGENIETVVEPLREALLELGAPHVQIGASRKVTQDLNWLPDDRQIGQTGVTVNPRVLLALGVSGAPQHLDYIGDRAVIFAFNLDSQAPIMTLNQRRERPRVYPVVGDLFETVPKFIEALQNRPNR